MPRYTSYLATFSAGVLGVLAYHLIREALLESASTLLVVGSIIAGVLLLEILHRIIPHAHHHHEASPHEHTAVDGRRVLISDAIHNIGDGFLIVPAFLVDVSIGIAATVGIMLHELVQEISEFFILKQAGYSNQRALALNFLSSSSILVGVALTLTLSSFGLLLTVLSGAAAGGFLSVIFRDLIPNALSCIKEHGRFGVHVCAFLIGSAVMLSITTLIPE